MGAARAEFKTLERVWSHSTLPRHKKLQIFEACVLSKLLYCLHTVWLNKQELAKIDALQARCLRRIMGIQHSYFSRVSNQAVLAEAQAQRLSIVLLKRQLLLLGKKVSSSQYVGPVVEMIAYLVTALMTIGAMRNGVITSGPQSLSLAQPSGGR